MEIYQLKKLADLLCTCEGLIIEYQPNIGVTQYIRAGMPWIGYDQANLFPIELTLVLTITHTDPETGIVNIINVDLDTITKISFFRQNIQGIYSLSSEWNIKTGEVITHNDDGCWKL